MSIEERISVSGAEQAKRSLDEVAAAQERVAGQVDGTGEKGEAAARKVGRLGAAGKEVIDAFSKLGSVATIFATIQGLVDQIVESLREAVELQDRLSGKSADFGEAVKTASRQLDIGESAGAGVVSRLRQAGGLDVATARDLIIGSDIALGKANMGGLLAGNNLAVIEGIAAFAGTKGFSGSEAADLVKLLGLTGNLTSADAAKSATAQIAAAAQKSDASSVGAFVAQTLRGATGLIQQRVPLQDVLVMGAQARGAEVSEELAAQTLITLEQVSVAGAEPKFLTEIDRVAAERGLSPESLTSAQRVQLTRGIFGRIDSQAEQDRIQKLMSPERFLRLSKAFRASNVAATRPVEAAIAGATAVQFDAAVDEGRGELSFRQAQNQAAQEHEEFVAGAEVFIVAEARRRAASRVDQDIARGIKRGLGREVEEERYVRLLFEQQRDALRRRGVDTSEIDTALEDLGTLIPFIDTRAPILDALPFVGGLFQGTGYSDRKLRVVADAIGRAELGAPRATTVINHIGTQYNDVDPSVQPPRTQDFGQ